MNGDGSPYIAALLEAIDHATWELEFDTAPTVIDESPEWWRL